MLPTNYRWTDVNEKLGMTWFVNHQFPNVYEDVATTPGILGDTLESSIFSCEYFNNTLFMQKRNIVKYYNDFLIQMKLLIKPNQMMILI